MDISRTFGWTNSLDHIIEPFDHLEHDPDPYCGCYRLRAFPSPGGSTAARIRYQSERASDNWLDVHPASVESSVSVGAVFLKFPEIKASLRTGLVPILLGFVLWNVAAYGSYMKIR